MNLLPFSLQPLFLPSSPLMPSPMGLVAGSSVLLAVLFWVSLTLPFLRDLIGPPDDFLWIKQVPWLWQLLFTAIALLSIWPLMQRGMQADFRQGFISSCFFFVLLVAFLLLHDLFRKALRLEMAHARLQHFRKMLWHPHRGE